MNYFFVITGPSACGKTTLLYNGKNKTFGERAVWSVASKYSTRARREGDFFDDIAMTKSKQEIYSDPNLDYRYIMNGKIYAFSSTAILTELQKNNVAIICSDLGTIRKLRKDPNLKKCLVVLFVAAVPATAQVTEAWIQRKKSSYEKNPLSLNNHSDFSALNALKDKLPASVESYFSIIGRATENVQSTRNENVNDFEHFSYRLQELYSEYVKMMPESPSYQQRIRNMDKFYYKYIEEIGYFDYTILNFFDPVKDKPEDEQMTRQVKHILEYLRTEERKEEQERNIPYNRHMLAEAKQDDQKILFFICAPKMSGKAILFSNLNLLSRDKIEIVRKIALRENKNNDAELAKGKGDGYGLSETYWMFDEKNDEDYEKLRALIKNADGKPTDSNENISLEKYVMQLLSRADVRVKELIAKAIEEQTKIKQQAQSEEAVSTNAPLQSEETSQNYDFTQWYWNFQSNYYAIDTIAAGNKNKHSIIISNMDQLENANKFATSVGKKLVPVFLVFSDYKARSELYHIQHYLNEGKSEDEAKQKGVELNEKIFSVIDNYYDNIGAFCHVIINSGIAEDVHDQITNIINLYVK